MKLYIGLGSVFFPSPAPTAHKNQVQHDIELEIVSGRFEKK